MRASFKLINQIKKHLKKVFGQRKYFALVYGSFVNGKRKSNSDIDLCVLTKEFTTTDLDNLKKFILFFHSQNKLKIDNEVPHDNKLIVTYKEAEDAAYLAGLKIRKNTIFIPTIKKSRKFLGSKPVKLRLISNALTSPHVVMGNDLKYYQKIKDLAEKNAFLLALSLSTENIYYPNQLLNCLLTSSTGQEGEQYLGYKKYPLVKSYIKTWLQKQNVKLDKTSRKRDWGKLMLELKLRSSSP